MCSMNMCEFCQAIPSAAEAAQKSEDSKERRFKKFLDKIAQSISEQTDRGYRSVIIEFEHLVPYCRPDLIQLQATIQMLEGKGYKVVYISGKYARLELRW